MPRPSLPLCGSVPTGSVGVPGFPLQAHTDGSHPLHLASSGCLLGWGGTVSDLPALPSP